MAGSNVSKGKKINIISFIFFSFYMVLPNYFAIEFSESIPLLSASRLILIFCYFFIILRNNGKIPFSMIINIDRNVKIYFLIFVLLSIIHIVDRGLSSLNQLFIIIFEQFGVLWLIMMLINSKQKFKKSVEILIYSSAIVAIISIMGFCFNTNFFYLLKTVNRLMTQAGVTDIGYRNGLLRVEAGFGHPVYYGMYCSVMIFACLYFYNYEKGKIRFLSCLLLNIVALLLTNSRGTILAVAITFIISYFINGWEERKKYFKIILILILVVITVFIFSSKIREYIFSLIQSIFVYFGLSDKTLNYYGANTDFTSDRFMQFSGIIWTLLHAPIIGYGYEAQSTGVISYYNRGQWFESTTFDVGYVAIFCCYGILGMLGCFFLVRSLIKNIKSIKQQPYFIMFRNIFIVYFLCLFSVVNIDKIFWVFFGLLLAYLRILNIERNG